MRRKSSAYCLFFVLILSAMHPEFVAAQEQGLEPAERDKIIKDLWSLLGLKPTAINGQLPPIPSIDTDIKRGILESDSSASDTNDTIMKDDSTSISDKNETLTPYVAGISNLTNSSASDTNNTIINDNSTNISDKNETFTPDVEGITNFTDSVTNSSEIIGNYSQNSEIISSENNTESSINSTDIPMDESNFFTNTLTNDTNLNTTEISVDNASNDSMNTNRSSFPVIQDSNNVQNGTISESITTLLLETTENRIPNMDEYFTGGPTQQDIPSTAHIINNSDHCSILPEFYKTCQLPIEYINRSDSLTTFADLKEKMATEYLRNCLLKYCEAGEWCLGSALDHMVSESLNISSKFCSSQFLMCLRTTEGSYSSCDNYKKFQTIRISLELICMYKTLSEYKPASPACGFHLLKLISVTLTDLERKDPSTMSGLGFCFSQRGYLMVSFNCLLSQCPEEFSTVLLDYQPWKWFTEERTNALTCQTYYECTRESTPSTWLTTTTYPRQVTGYDEYPWGGESEGPSEDYFERTTKNILTDNDKADIQIAKGLEDEIVDDDTQKFGETAAERSHMTASLSAMMVILMIGMVILMVVCWKHIKKNRTNRKGGYSKLKTGEC